MSDDREPDQAALTVAYAKMGGALTGNMLYAAVKAYLNSGGGVPLSEPADWMLASRRVDDPQAFMSRYTAIGALLDAVITFPETAEDMMLVNTRTGHRWTARYDSDGSTISVDKYHVDCDKGSMDAERRS